MDSHSLEKMLQMIETGDDSDALQGLRGLQGLLRHEGVIFTNAIQFAIENIDILKKSAPVIEQAPAPAGPRPPVTISGMPQCEMVRPGVIEIIKPGETRGEPVALTGAAMQDAESIATNLKDALVAATINKSRFKLKVVEIKNARGETIETELQAVYDRADMVAVRVWVNVRGEVATLAAVLRKAVANAVPELVAA